MPTRASRLVLKYLETARKHGPECILETAYEDEDLTDEEYFDLKDRLDRWMFKFKWVKEGGKFKWVEKAPPKPIICEGCGEPIPPEQNNPHGRKRKYHDNGNVCKQLAYRNRERARRDKAAAERKRRLAEKYAG